jgi:hypothetical protein
LVIPLAGRESGELLITMPGGHCGMVLELVAAELDVVCCAPAEAATAAPRTSDAPMVRHRTCRHGRVSEIDIFPP